MAQVPLTEQFVYYAAESRLLEIAVEIAQSRSISKPSIKALIQKGTKIRLWLEALDYGEYLDRDTRERIWYALADIANVIDVPVVIPTQNIQPPDILFGIPGQTGQTGSTGATGGGVAFSASNVGTDTVVDSFDITLSGSAQWQYEVYSGSNKRVETLTGTWLSDGSSFADDGGLTLDPDIGDTSPVTFGVNINGTTVELISYVASGTWEIRGTRLLIPVSGNGITLPTQLANGTVWIGNASNQPTSQTISGDVSVTNAGIASIGTGVIVNSDVSGSAAIAVSKLAALTALKAVVTDASGYLTTSATDASKVAYLANVTSDIQAQIDAIAGAGTITGAITTYVTSNATSSRAIVSNPAGKLTTSLTTSTEIGYLQGLTANAVGGVGTTNSLTKWTGSRTLGNSNITDNGTTVTINNLSSTTITVGSTIINNSGVVYPGQVSPISINTFDIGPWNLYTAGGGIANMTASFSITGTFLGALVFIVSDTGQEYQVSGFVGDSISTMVLPLDYYIASSTVFLRRKSGGTYDNSNFQSTAFNRGRVVVISTT